MRQTQLHKGQDAQESGLQSPVLAGEPSLVYNAKNGSRKSAL